MQIENDRKQRNGTERRISPKQGTLIAALITCPTIEQAATTAGISRTTAHRWTQQAAFREELQRRRDQIVDAALDVFRTHVLRAVTVLADLMGSENERIRRAAAKDVLDYVLRVRRLQEAETRLCQLEDRVYGDDASKPEQG